MIMKNGRWTLKNISDRENLSNQRNPLREIFAENSWYFRNSLARANYNDLGKGISATTIYLERFFENLLMGYQNELKNRC